MSTQSQPQPPNKGLLPKFLSNNSTYVKETFPALPAPWTMTERRPLAKASGQVTLVLTCLDPRCTPEQYFGPDFNSGALRNAGGRATEDVVRSITMLRGVAGVRNVVVVHHTDCGIMHVSTQDVVDAVSLDGEDARKAAGEIDYRFYGADELEQSVREDVRILRSAKSLKGVNIWGFTLETFTGEVKEVQV